MLSSGSELENEALKSKMIYTIYLQLVYVTV